MLFYKEKIATLVIGFCSGWHANCYYLTFVYQSVCKVPKIKREYKTKNKKRTTSIKLPKGKN